MPYKMLKPHALAINEADAVAARAGLPGYSELMNLLVALSLRARKSEKTKSKLMADIEKALEPLRAGLQ